MPRNKLKTTLILIALLFICALTVAAYFKALPVTIFVLYVILSLMTFIFYWVDKSAAQRNKWRTKEVTLHVLALFGGWPGALLAQQVIRHKSQKMSFQLVFWLTVLLNLAVLVWLLSGNGAEVLSA